MDAAIDRDTLKCLRIIQQGAEECGIRNVSQEAVASPQNDCQYFAGVPDIQDVDGCTAEFNNAVAANNAPTQDAQANFTPVAPEGPAVV